MEFRCPACNTSYRVPVRIDQQVRCARCNHVWRISESDFVIAEEMQDESEMPEAFSSPGADDVPEARQDGAMAQAADEDDISSMLERDETWDDREADESPAFSDWSARDAIPQEAQYAPAEGAPPPGRHDAAPEDDGNPADGFEAEGPSPEDAESFDRRLADSWFSRTADQPGDAGGQDADSHAAFERIMEGIEEVIAERGGSDDSGTDRALSQSDDPLRALMSDERARNLGGTLQGEPPAAEPPSDDDDWGGKVVRLTARGAERRAESPAQDQQPMREADTAPSQGSEAVEPMAELIDKIAAGRAEPSDFEPHEPQERDPAARDADAMNQAHFDALQADMEDAAHIVQQSGDDLQRDEAAENWAIEGYRDEAHEDALRESLAFDTEQEAFESPERAEPLEDRYAFKDEAREDGLAARDADHDDERMRDEPADIFTADPREDRRADNRPAETDAQDDDALLAEYDFGDEQESETPPEVADQARRGAGTLTVAAAWALFVAVMAGAAGSAVSFRDQIAEVLPASAPVYAAIGFPVDPPPLVFGEVGYSWDETSRNTLILTGQVKNNRSELTEVPNMRITARDDNGEVVAEESQFLGQSALMPGETYEFRVNFEVSPEQLRTLELRF